MTSLATRKPLAVLTLALLTLVPSVVRANNNSKVPSGTIYSAPLTTDGSQRVFTGNVSPFGQVVGNLSLSINPDGSYTGQFEFLGKGGTAYGTIQGQFLSASSYYETLTFTGGTGKYAGISGYANFYGMLNSDGTAEDTVTGGMINLP